MFLTYFSRIIEYNGRSKTNCKGSEKDIDNFVQVMRSFFGTLDVERKNDEKKLIYP